ncbi:unnamed protein product [Effrenium voratum]|uniref:Uncharacterized protein n=1 Tax=Effrenium voratum TaxID=2562239 RepID=A0AA36MRD7_9DINO|nr:unnamed protein product [Effrenium voratum]
MAVEAVLRFRKIQETEDKDRGVFVRWEKVLEHYKGHTEEARDFVARRQREKGGTSRCRNDPAIETYLLFGEQEKTIRTKTLEDVALECGCDAAVAVDLMRAMDQGQQVGSVQAAGQQSLPGASDPPAPPQNKPPKKARVAKEKPAGTNMEELKPEDADVAAFVNIWVKSSTDAQGVCTSISAQLRG